MTERENHTIAFFPNSCSRTLGKQPGDTSGVCVGYYTDNNPIDKGRPAMVRLEAQAGHEWLTYVLSRDVAIALSHSLLAAASECDAELRFHKRFEKEEYQEVGEK